MAANPDRYGRPANHDRLIMLNLGLGRDSMTMLCLAAKGQLRAKGLGKLALEDLDYVVFSDPGREWPHTNKLVKRVRDFIGGRVPFYVLRKPKKLPPRPPGLTAKGKRKARVDKWRVSSMAEIAKKARAGGYHYRREIFKDYAYDRPGGATVPGFKGDCTMNHKVGPMRRLINDMSLLRFGLDNTQWGDAVKAGEVQPHVALIGIAADEPKRILTTMKAQAKGEPRYITELMPLVDMGIGKDDEVPILKECGFADVRKSGCYMCKYQPPSWWWALSVAYPKLFREIVLNERRSMRTNKSMNVTGAKWGGKLRTLPEIVARWRAQFPQVTVDEALDKSYDMDAKKARAAYKAATGSAPDLDAIKGGAFVEDVITAAAAPEECYWDDDPEPFDLIAMARAVRKNPIEIVKQRLLSY